MSDDLFPRWENAIANVKALGYNVIESATVRNRVKCVSADPATRAAEFMSLYESKDVMAIIPPWGGEFLMEILPLLDFEKLAAMPPKWISGYSDITTLTFPLTLLSDVATIHGSNFMNMGGASIAEADLAVFEVMSTPEPIQHSAEYYSDYTPDFADPTKETYHLGQKSEWKSLQGKNDASFSGRMIGGCMDTICKLIGTRFAPVPAFLEKYKQDGFIWHWRAVKWRQRTSIVHFGKCKSADGSNIVTALLLDGLPDIRTRGISR